MIHLSLPIEEDVSITMQEAMLIELRVTTNNFPATGQPASQPSWQALATTVHSLLLKLAIQSEEVNMVGGH